MQRCIALLKREVEVRFGRGRLAAGTVEDARLLHSIAGGCVEGTVSHVSGFKLGRVKCRPESFHIAMILGKSLLLA